MTITLHNRLVCLILYYESFFLRVPQKLPPFEKLAETIDIKYLLYTCFYDKFHTGFRFNFQKPEILEI